jgi:hypothetical protein
VSFRGIVPLEGVSSSAPGQGELSRGQTRVVLWPAWKPGAPGEPSFPNSFWKPCQPPSRGQLSSLQSLLPPALLAHLGEGREFVNTRNFCL